MASESESKRLDAARQAISTRIAELDSDMQRCESRIHATETEMGGYEYQRKAYQFALEALGPPPAVQRGRGRPPGSPNKAPRKPRAATPNGGDAHEAAASEG